VRFVAGGARLEREIGLPAAWQRAHLELAAFVQDEPSGRVLQALGGRCRAGS
jgi:hypothetical protein